MEWVTEARRLKTAVLGRCAAECLKTDGAAVSDWLIRLMNICFVNSWVTE